MPSWVWLVLFIVAVLVYTGYRIRALQRRADRQWREVDRSKLRRFDDDEDD